MQNAESSRLIMTPEMLEAVRRRVRTSIEDPRPSLNASEVERRLHALHTDTVTAHGKSM